MEIFLQIWGGIFYLANKIFFSLSETDDNHRKIKFKLIAWSVYLIGVPAWVVLLVGRHDWIAASIEASGVPSMMLGWYKTCFQKEASNVVEKFVKYITYISIVIGLSISIYHYGGIVSFSQWLEIGVTVGFLLGSYLMTQQNPNGYLFFMLMNLSMALLMAFEGRTILIVQQLISLLFVIYGYLQTLKREIKSQS